MRKSTGKFPFFPDIAENLKILKLITIVTPTLLVLLIELLRHTDVAETLPEVVNNLILVVVVTVASFFFSNFVFDLITRKQKENLRRNWELAVLNDISQTVNETLNLNTLLRLVMEKVIQVVGADSGEIFLINEKSHDAVFTLRAGVSADASKPDSSLLATDGLVNEVAWSNEPVIIQDIKISKRLLPTLDTAQFRSLAVIPLKSRSGTAGVLGLLSLKAGHFRPDESGLLLKIGGQIAVAVENARLYEKVQAMAIIEERERISKELHDGLAQVLGYVITKSQATRQILRKMAVANDYLVELENIAQDVYTDTREDIMGLRTVISGDRDMVAVLREYLTRFSQMHGIKVTLEVGDQIIPSLSPRVELQAIRIIQEALSNIRKHANATRATVKLTTDMNVVTLVVADDGNGFDINKLGQGDWSKFGIRTIKERAESINSKLDIESRPEYGTKVTLTIPLNIRDTAVEEGKEIESTTG